MGSFFAGICSEPFENAGIWTSDKSVAIPQEDVVSFAFGRADEYDQDRPIFIDASDPSKFITAREARHKVKQIAAGLQAKGLKPGDCVCVHTFNSILYPLFYLGTIAAGGVITGTNPKYTAGELTHHFKTTDAKFVIAHVSYIKAVEEAINTCKIPQSSVYLLGCNNAAERSEYGTFEQLLTHGDQPSNPFEESIFKSSREAIYGSTSGTTGAPKAAVLSHQYVVAQATVLEDMYEERVKHGKAKQILSLPLFHSFAAHLCIALPLRLGMTTYIMERYDQALFLQAVEQYEITDSALVPKIIVDLLKCPFADLLRLDSLRHITCAGSVMNPNLQAKFNDLLHPDATVVQTWGTTELGWVSTFPAGERDDTGSVGRLIANGRLKIVDANGNKIVEEGVAGEGCIFSTSMMLRYRGDDALNKGVFDDEGYYRTGDSLFIKDGRVYLGDRIKDIIKVNGFQVAPLELQEVIMSIGGIEDCAVAGVDKVDTDGLTKSFPRAYVVKKQGSSITADAICDWVAKKLIGYKRLTGGVCFVDEIPRNPTGKILRRLLAEKDA